MDVPSRSRRRNDRLRMKARMRRLWLVYQFDRRGTYTEEPDAAWLGVMTSTHGKPCSCGLGCGNRRRYDGPPIGERRSE
jgi:hypothetical protein